MPLAEDVIRRVEEEKAKDRDFDELEL